MRGGGEILVSGPDLFQLLPPSVLFQLKVLQCAERQCNSLERKRQSSYSSAGFSLPLLYMQMTISIWLWGTPYYIGKHDVRCIHYSKPLSWESGCICFFSKIRVHQVEGNSRGCFWKCCLSQFMGFQQAAFWVEWMDLTLPPYSLET